MSTPNGAFAPPSRIHLDELGPSGSQVNPHDEKSPSNAGTTMTERTERTNQQEAIVEDLPRRSAWSRHSLHSAHNRNSQLVEHLAADEWRKNQNLASVINNPNRRPSETGLGIHIGSYFTSKTLMENVNALLSKEPELELMPLPELNLSDFETYMNTVLNEYPGLETALRKRREQLLLSRENTLASDDPNGSSDADLKALVKKERKEKAEEEDSSAVPNDYFDPHYDVAHHEIFSKASLGAIVSGSDDAQEQLLEFLDIVELELFHHLSNCDHLLDALAKVQRVREDISSSLSKITSLKATFRNLKQSAIAPSIEVAKLSRRRKRLEQVLERLDLLSTVHQTGPSIRVLISAGDFVTGLSLLESTESVLDDQLKGVVSVQPLRRELEDLNLTLDSRMEAEFVHYGSESLTHPESVFLEVPEIFAGAEVPSAARDLHKLLECLARRKRLDVRFQINCIYPALKFQFNFDVDASSRCCRPGDFINNFVLVVIIGGDDVVQGCAAVAAEEVHQVAGGDAG